MAFMVLQTQLDVWYDIETESGESFLIPESVCGYLPIPSGHTDVSEDDCTPEDWECICSQVRDYTDGEPVSEVSARSGYCGRYSAPGYMDCTDWCGPYETEKEAEKEAREIYGDDESEEEEATDAR